jgi:hypothetical protein
MGKAENAGELLNATEPVLVLIYTTGIGFVSAETDPPRSSSRGQYYPLRVRNRARVEAIPGTRIEGM